MAKEAPLDIKEVLKELDVFKLAIRGHAAIEDVIDATITEAFGGSTPNELRRLPFRTRLALLVALTPLPKKYAKAIDALAQLRHDFAHGRLDELTSERANAIGDEFRATLPESMGKQLDRASDPRGVLVLCVFSAHMAVEITRELARKRREEERKALKLQEDLKKLLAEQESH